MISLINFWSEHNFWYIFFILNLFWQKQNIGPKKILLKKIREKARVNPRDGGSKVNPGGGGGDRRVKKKNSSRFLQ